MSSSGDTFDYDINQITGDLNASRLSQINCQSIDPLEIVHNSFNLSLLCNNKSEDPAFNPFTPSVGVQVLWTVLFSVVVVSSIAGNIIVIAIILCYQQMRTKTNYFLLNLSVADLMMTITNCMPNFVFMLKGHWPFGATFCVVNNFLGMTFTASSVFTVTATSLDRFMAVVYPLSPRIDQGTSLLAIIILWILAAILSSPLLIYSSLHHSTYQYENRTLCILKWPDGLQNMSQMDYIYNIIVISLTYFVPMAIMLYAYSRMSFVLWGSRTIGEATDHQLEAVKSKQKVVPMLITVSIVFGICWLPYQIYFLVFPLITRLVQGPSIQHIYLAFYWLAMFNSSLNPLIYCLLNKRFRRYSKKIILNVLHLRSSGTLVRGHSMKSDYETNMISLATYGSIIDTKCEAL
ncbi:tachykinin-like peptides receptor 86C [Brevipalpus obovatus]|uniref:tachykinin-like peptides receptor 86C n=1 Tax=Brevipalpus obovatus TaxID=246614 RepID=UPI003D9ED12E